MNDFLHSHEALDVINFTLPRFRELPTIDLYMDQVILCMEHFIGPISPHNEKSFITSTMVGNYVKQGIVTPPRKKKYTQKHLAYLVVVCLLKHVFSMSQICDLIQVHIDKYPTDVAYDYFCTELEKALREVFSSSSSHGESLAMQVTAESEIVRKAAISYANYLYIEKYLLFRKSTLESQP